jgi:hypothetical protein
MPDAELHALRQQLKALERRNSELEAQLALSQNLDDGLYRFLFDTMDEDFCIIEFFDGPHGPLSDYVHIMANDSGKQLHFEQESSQGMSQAH